ncbi:mercury resistance system transport protein MerF [Hoeflea sp.]|uniref:mercury resistance system transport protein MerF n=1 Tax=Hoeflea sp. TaxID=1940281 RepID=UPI003A916D06
MTDKGILTTGIIGTVIAALCCFTPVLVILFGVVGLSAIVGYLDYVLLPALAFFVLLTLYALWRRQCHTQVS